MMKNIELQRQRLHHGDLVLVNAKHPLRRSEMQDMIPADMSFPDILMKREAANALKLIIEKISAGDSIIPVSGYRSPEEQGDIYMASLKDNGEDFTRQYVAMPEHSEHQTGLAIDLGVNKNKMDFICPDFPYDGICNEFRHAAAEYGFIERYEKGKEGLTGIAHEPWHFRYVGYPHSIIMKERGFALEEYTEYIKRYRNDCRLVYSTGRNLDVEIYYIPADDDCVVVSVPEDCVYRVSGNNTDGFVMTLWKKSN